MKLFGKKDKKEERKGKEFGKEFHSEKVNIGPGETKELMIGIPTELIDEAKRQGKTKAIIGMKYNDENGEEYEQDFEFNIETGEIREVIDADIKEIRKDKKRPILGLEYIGKEYKK